jgi:CheY-like chemotaxis protein
MRRVLIVDDDEDFRETLSALLTLEGYEVEVASNGREGLERLGREALPHIVLLDLMMPIMNGWEVIEVMKRNPTLARIPAAVLSAARGPENIPDQVTVFAKPFALAELLQFMRAAC